MNKPIPLHTSPQGIRDRLKSIYEKIDALREEAQSLQLMLNQQTPQNGISLSTASSNRSFAPLESLSPSMTADQLPQPIFQSSPELLAPPLEETLPSTRTMHTHIDNNEWSSHLGEGLPPGQSSTGPMHAPPQATAQNDNVAHYHQNPFFVDTSLVNKLSTEQLDQLPYGVIQLDARGTVIGYNDTEARMVGYPKEKVIGKNFFTGVAPCTRVQEFEGRFRAMAEGRSSNPIETFEFVFNFRKGAQRVLIMLFPGRKRGTFNITLIRK